MVAVAHGALPGEPVDLVEAVPREHVPPRHADDEVPAVLHEGPVERGPVAAPVADRDALAPGRGHDRGDELEDFVVFPEMPWSARRPELERERDGLAPAVLAGDRHAAVIAVHEDFPALLRGAACVPDHRHVLHAEPELLADIRRVDKDEGAVPDVPRALRENRLVDFVADVFARHIAAQALFDGMPHVGVVVDGPHDRRELRAAGGLDPVEHVCQKLLLRPRKTGKHFAQKFSELLFRPEGDCAIIHAVVFSFRLVIASCSMQENGWGRPRFVVPRWKAVGWREAFLTGGAVARAKPIGVKFGGFGEGRTGRS